MTALDALQHAADAFNEMHAALQRTRGEYTAAPADEGTEMECANSAAKYLALAKNSVETALSLIRR